METTCGLEMETTCGLETETFGLEDSISMIFCCLRDANHHL